MASCEKCGSTKLVPSPAPWCMGPINARLFNTVRCSKCGAFVKAVTGKPVLPLYCTIITLQILAVFGIVLLACIGHSLNGRLELWFGVPFAVVFIASFVAVFWVARTHHPPNR